MKGTTGEVIDASTVQGALRRVGTHLEASTSSLARLRADEALSSDTAAEARRVVASFEGTARELEAIGDLTSSAAARDAAIAAQQLADVADLTKQGTAKAKFARMIPVLATTEQGTEVLRNRFGTFTDDLIAMSHGEAREIREVQRIYGTRYFHDRTPPFLNTFTESEMHAGTTTVEGRVKASNMGTRTLGVRYMLSPRDQYVFARARLVANEHSHQAIVVHKKLPPAVMTFEAGSLRDGLVTSLAEAQAQLGARYARQVRELATGMHGEAQRAVAARANLVDARALLEPLASIDPSRADAVTGARAAVRTHDDTIAVSDPDLLARIGATSSRPELPTLTSEVIARTRADRLSERRNVMFANLAELRFDAPDEHRRAYDAIEQRYDSITNDAIHTSSAFDAAAGQLDADVRFLAHHADMDVAPARDAAAALVDADRQLLEIEDEVARPLAALRARQDAEAAEAARAQAARVDELRTLLGAISSPKHAHAKTAPDVLARRRAAMDARDAELAILPPEQQRQLLTILGRPELHMDVMRRQFEEHVAETTTRRGLLDSELTALRPRLEADAELDPTTALAHANQLVHAEAGLSAIEQQHAEAHALLLGT